MQLRNQRIVVTGATGGIGSDLCRRLAAEGAHLLLVGRSQNKLEELAADLPDSDTQRVVTIAADVTTNEGRQGVARMAMNALGGVDMLINNAGITDFSEFSAEDPALIERIFKTNTHAPVLLTRELLPQMLQQGRGTIVNVGSIFGSIGFACFAAYSSSKFALRGFSEALRRELEGTGVNVIYVAPRATKTTLNSDAVYRMADQVKMNMDTPDTVARQIVGAIKRGKKERFFGWPESLFVRINALLPRLVDGALRKQNRIMKEHAHNKGA